MPATPKPPPDRSFERYAIYWSPDPGSRLARFGARWFAAEETLAAELGVSPAELEGAIAEPRRYGLHGTLVAPFRLAEGIDAAALNAHLRGFAKARPALPMGRLRLARIGAFLALVAAEARESRLRGLHTQCLFAFETFRGESTTEDAARRAPAAGRTTEKLLVAQWGYAHVLHLFRFHVTLTGRLGEAALARFAEVLAPALEMVNAEPATLDALCLYGDPGNKQPLALIDRHPLATEPAS